MQGKGSVERYQKSNRLGESHNQCNHQVLDQSDVQFGGECLDTSKVSDTGKNRRVERP